VHTRVNNSKEFIRTKECKAIDEIITAFKGRSSMKQCNEAKPHKHQKFALASKSGIVHALEMCLGNGTLKFNANLGLSRNILWFV